MIIISAINAVALEKKSQTHPVPYELGITLKSGEGQGDV